MRRERYIQPRRLAYDLRRPRTARPRRPAGRHAASDPPLQPLDRERVADSRPHRCDLHVACTESMRCRAETALRAPCDGGSVRAATAEVPNAERVLDANPGIASGCILAGAYVLQL